MRWQFCLKPPKTVPIASSTNTGRVLAFISKGFVSTTAFAKYIAQKTLFYSFLHGWGEISRLAPGRSVHLRRQQSLIIIIVVVDLVNNF